MNPYDFYITPEEYGLAAEKGISRNLLTQRIRILGWSKEKALSTPPRKFIDRKKWMEVAKQNGIPYHTARNRVFLLGWTWERAVSEPLETQEQKRMRMRKQNTVKRKYPKEFLELASKNGIKPDTFRSRVTRFGWSLERAATEPVMSPSKAGQVGVRSMREKGFNINGAFFKNKSKTIGANE